MKNTRMVYFILSVIVITTVLFFQGGPDYHASRSYKGIWNLGHIFYYTLWVYILLRGWPGFAQKSFAVQFGWLLTFGIFTGALLELIQVQFDRITEWGDLWRDVVGILLGVVLFSTFITSLPRYWRRLLRGIILIIVAIEFIAPGKALTDEMIARSQFPLLSAFETPWECERWEPDNRITRTTEIVLERKYAAQVPLTTDRYSGVNLKYFQRDWSGYRLLHFAVYNPLDSLLSLTCRIHDWQHVLNQQPFSDRFNRRLTLLPGWNVIEIPLAEVVNAPAGRQMDLRKIYNLGIFAVSLDFPINIYLDDVRLIP